MPRLIWPLITLWAARAATGSGAAGGAAIWRRLWAVEGWGKDRKHDWEEVRPRGFHPAQYTEKGAGGQEHATVLVIDEQCFNAVFCGLVRNLKKMNKNRGLGWENKVVWKKFMRFARMGIIPCPQHLAKGVWKASGGVKSRYSYRPTNNQTPNSQINQLPLGHEKIAHRHPDVQRNPGRGVSVCG
jgi:hypothetical protein